MLRIGFTGVLLLASMAMLLQIFRRGGDLEKQPQQKITHGHSMGAVSTSRKIKNKNYLTFPKHLRKAIVMGALASENTSWVTSELPDWEPMIYIVNAVEAGVHATLTTPKNKGNEAGVYLWYILENYHNLPDVMAFLHAHRDGNIRAWHVDNEQNSNPLSIQRLRLETVLRQGFVNLRCQLWPGCARLLVIDYQMTELPEVRVTRDYMPAAIREMFPYGWMTGQDVLQDDKTSDRKDPIAMFPEAIAAPCCAQFAVSRDQVLSRPLEDYRRYYNWLMNTTLPDAESGRVMEFLWHIVFGRDPVYCPLVDECYCNNYGIGDDCPT